MSHPERYDHHIGGQRVAPSDGAYFPSTNPATGAGLYEAARGTAADVYRAVEAARASLRRPALAGPEPDPARATCCAGWATSIAEHADELARMETLDNGKLLREMRAQLAVLPEYYHYYARAGRQDPGRRHPDARTVAC